MPSSFIGSGRTPLFAACSVAVILTALLLAGRPSTAEKGSSLRAVKHNEERLNYDIRTDKNAAERLTEYRLVAGRGIAAVEDFLSRTRVGETALRKRVPTLKIDYNTDLKVPEVIATDVTKGRSFLTDPSTTNKAAILKDFLHVNSELIGARSGEIAELRVFADYTNPDGKLSFVELNQFVNGVPVFRGEIKAGFSTKGEIVRVINNFAPGIDPSAVSREFGDPGQALTAAALHIGIEVDAGSLQVDADRSSDLRTYFGTGDFSPSVEKIYFPTEPGVAVPARRVLLWQRSGAFYVIVDGTGRMLWRKNLTEHQTQSATYNVYANPNAMINVADSPFPMTPGTSAPDGTQAAGIPRTLVTRIGNEAPYTFNNVGWIPDGANTTDGNNVQAGLDRQAPNIGSLDPDAIDISGMPEGQPSRVFDFAIDPAIPSNPPLGGGSGPLPVGQQPHICLDEGTDADPTDFQKASVTHMFYVTNLFHDEMYRLGFTEAARNFQHDNFGRGGVGGDRISAQAQDCSDFNNANFTTPADGNRPQMQVYIWTGPNPDIDGALDSDTIIHELTHGLSNRLVGNSSGLTLDIARGLGEGWSDFYASCLLSEPDDPVDGLYTIAAYSSYQFSSVGFNNYYYGIRRFPRAVSTALGGPQNKPHNPLTFADIDITKIDLSDAAFNPRHNPLPDQVHAIGEVWSAALWEIRARMIQRLGWEAGNRRVLQIVTDGMKLTPLGPTPVSARDAIVASVFASGDAADLADVWAGFAIRGLGAGASVQNIGGISTGGTGTVRVTESFDLPNLQQAPAITVDDPEGDNDGYPEPGETVSVAVPITNSTGRVAQNVTASITGGGSANYGTLAGIATETKQVSYMIPACNACGSNVPVTINANSTLGPISFTRSIFIGTPTATTPDENFDAVTAPSIPTGWSAVSIDGGLNFENSTTLADSGPNAMYARNPTTVGGGTNLTSPPVSVTSSAATVTFRNQYRTENGWDGGVLEISIAGGDFQDILTAGGTFLAGGYNGALGGGRNNPIASRAGWTGNSNGFITTTVGLPAEANGRLVHLRWRFGADDNTAVPNEPNPGWRVDSITLAGAGFVTELSCSINSQSFEVTGRVLTPQGTPVRNALVTLIDPCSQVRTATSSSFGIVNFSVPPGSGYLMTVRSKRYRFAPRTINIDSVTSIDMIGLE